MASSRVAVVTGSNKGIGLAIVRALCKQFDGDVYVTSRDDGRGKEAMEVLKKEGLNPKYHQLDIDDQTSIDRLRDHLKEQYGGLDVLVNNAAILFTEGSTMPFEQQVELTMRTNFFSLLAVCKTLFEILRPHARVVNLSSFLAGKTLANLSQERKEQILSAKSIADIQNLMIEFVKDAKAGNCTDKGWSSFSYGMSKVGVTALSIIQQTHLEELGKADVVVNAADPGFVETDMTRSFGKASEMITPDEGAETPVYLALLPANVTEPKGKHVSDKKIVEWR